MTGLKKLLQWKAAQPKEKFIGGLPVLIDNAFYGSGNGTADSVITDSDYFITGFFDTESTGEKSYTYSMIERGSTSTYMRAFNDQAGASVDYWGNGELPENLPKTRTISCAGQFIAFSVYKPTAADTYMYDNTNARYVFNGRNVTE